MPSPGAPAHASNVAGADVFGMLLKCLAAEHTRVVEERDYFQRLCSKSPDGPSANSTICGDDVLGDANDFHTASVEAGPPRERQPKVVAVPSLEIDGGCHSSEWTSRSRIETPRLIRDIRPGGSLAEAALHDSSRLRASTGEEDDPDLLRLDHRWLDVYVSQQMQTRLRPDVAKACSNFELELWDNCVRRRTAIESGSHNQLPDICSGSASESLPPAPLLWQEVPFVPHQAGRIAWSLFGGPLLLYDVIAIPWQIAWNESQPHALSLLSALYWALDIIVELNTALVGPTGLVNKSRKAVTQRYVSRRCCIDAALLVVDIVAILSVDVAAGMSWYRFARLSRALRIIRVFRLSNLRETIEELMFHMGIDRLLLIFNIGQTILSIFILAHVVSCGWYYLGREQVRLGGASWLDPFLDACMWETYLHSVHYALGHLTGGPVNPRVVPTTDAEHLFSVGMIAMSVLVVGTIVSKITNAIADLHRARLAAADTKRKLIQVLRASGADADLSTRILKFGMHVYDRRASLSVEGSVMRLLSQALASELTVCQRSRYFAEHALLNTLRCRFPEIFARICSAFETHMFADADDVFQAGTVSECLYITARGRFTLTTPIKHWRRLQRRYERHEVQGARAKLKVELSDVGDAVLTQLQGVHWLCEISLFATAVHKSDLRTTSFADAFSLTGTALVACIEKSPSCVCSIYNYAREYLRSVNEAQGSDGDAEIVPQDVPHEICEKIFTQEEASGYDERDGLDSPATDLDRVSAFVNQIASGASSSQDDLVENLPMVFGELHPHLGIYHALKMEGERRRAIAAMASVVHLIQNDYESFCMSQGSDRITKDLWGAMQRFVEWVGITEESVHAILVFLAIRGIGKAKPFLQAMRRDEQTPEVVVLALLCDFPRKVPSHAPLTSGGQILVEKAFELHRTFNFAQFLQGENTPKHVGVLQSIIQQEGEAMLRFYLFSLVGVMCGLRGEESLQGSLFLNQVNGEMLLAGVRVLQSLQTASPCGIYWAFLAERAAALRLKFDSLERLAFVRLACLARTPIGDIGALQEDWSRLSVPDRETLIQHFVADGISTLAFAFTFLPAYLANAKRNPAVGMHRALTVLVELIEALQRDGYAEKIGARMLTVNLQELADFAATAQSAGAFMVVHVHSSLSRRKGALDFVISARHKQDASQPNWSDDPTNEIRALMRRVERRVDCVNQQLQRAPKVYKVS